MENDVSLIDGILTYNELYWNIFDYPLYIGICLLMMLIYSIIYVFLATYVERVNPGEFGIAQPWNYLFKKSYWNSSTVQPSEIERNAPTMESHWIEMETREKKKVAPTMTINHLTKVTSDEEKEKVH